MTPLEGGVIHVGKGDGALDLVGAVADQENHGAVGVDALDGAAAVARRVAEETRRLGLIFNHVVLDHGTPVVSIAGHAARCSPESHR